MSVSSSTVDDNQLIPLLLGDLHADLLEHRIACAKRLGMIALAIGPEKTRTELLPSLLGLSFDILCDNCTVLFSEHLDVDDEVLCVIAEELGTIIPFVGGPQYMAAVLNPLEKLCMVEELAVTEKVFPHYHKYLSNRSL